MQWTDKMISMMQSVGARDNPSTVQFATVVKDIPINSEDVIKIDTITLDLEDFVFFGTRIPSYKSGTTLAVIQLSDSKFLCFGEVCNL